MKKLLTNTILSATLLFTSLSLAAKDAFVNAANDNQESTHLTVAANNDHAADVSPEAVVVDSTKTTEVQAFLYFAGDKYNPNGIGDGLGPGLRKAMGAFLEDYGSEDLNGVRTTLDSLNAAPSDEGLRTRTVEQFHSQVILPLLADPTIAEFLSNVALAATSNDDMTGQDIRAAAVVAGMLHPGYTYVSNQINLEVVRGALQEVVDGKAHTKESAFLNGELNKTTEAGFESAVIDGGTGNTINSDNTNTTVAGLSSDNTYFYMDGVNAMVALDVDQENTNGLHVGVDFNAIQTKTIIPIAFYRTEIAGNQMDLGFTNTAEGLNPGLEGFNLGDPTALDPTVGGTHFRGFENILGGTYVFPKDTVEFTVLGKDISFAYTANATAGIQVDDIGNTFDFDKGTKTSFTPLAKANANLVFSENLDLNTAVRYVKDEGTILDNQLKYKLGDPDAFGGSAAAALTKQFGTESNIFNLTFSAEGHNTWEISEVFSFYAQLSPYVQYKEFDPLQPIDAKPWSFGAFANTIFGLSVPLGKKPNTGFDTRPNVDLTFGAQTTYNSTLVGDKLDAFPIFGFNITQSL